MIVLNYYYKIKPTQSQIKTFERYLETHRKVYNYALKERIDWINSKKCNLNSCSIKQEYIIPASQKFPNYNIQSANLTIAKKHLPTLKSVNAQSLQQTLKRLDKSWQDFLNIKERGFPRFKTKSRFRSFKFPDVGKNCFKGNLVKLPSIGWIRIRKSREYPIGFKPATFQVVRKASG